MKELTKDEVIIHLKTALEKYADSKNWNVTGFSLKEDVCKDNCSGLYLNNGEIARQALHAFGKRTVCSKN